MTKDPKRLSDPQGELQVALDKRVADVTQREQKCLSRELDCRHREALIELKEKHATERVTEMRDVVKDVFGNNRFKYTEHATVSVPIAPTPGLQGDPNGGYQQIPQPGWVAQGTEERTVEGEGDPPVKA